MRASLRRAVSGAAFFVLAATAASSVSAQVFTPTYTSPRILNDLGIYVSDGPGDLAIEGIWRGGPLGLRVGYVDARDGYLSIGGELRTPLALTTVPLGLAFVAGAQGLIGEDGGAGVQVGLSAGYTFTGTGLVMTPYLHPRVGLVSPFGPRGDAELEVMADVGIDFEIERNILLRIGFNLGEPGSSWGVGFAVRR